MIELKKFSLRLYKYISGDWYPIDTKYNIIIEYEKKLSTIKV